MLTVETKRLKTALKDLRKVTGSKAVRPNLLCARLEAGRLSATDLETAVELEIGARGDGVALIPTSSALDGLLDADTEIRTDGILAHLQSGPSQVTVTGGEISDYPDMTPRTAGHVAFTIDAAVLRSSLEKVIKSATRNQGRYAINGVHFANQGPGLELCTTDGHCLSLATVKLPFSDEHRIDSKILHVKAANLLIHLLKRAVGEVEVRTTSRELIFAADNFRLCSLVLEGVFPKYEQVIPSECEATVTVNVKDALKALDAFKFAKNSDYCVVDFVASGNVLTMEHKTPDSHNKLSITCLCLHTCPVIWALNPEYLKNLLSVHDERTVDLRWISPKRPLSIKTHRLTQVMMPVTGKKVEKKA